MSMSSMPELIKTFSAATAAWLLWTLGLAVESASAAEKLNIGYAAR